MSKIVIDNCEELEKVTALLDVIGVEYDVLEDEVACLNTEQQANAAYVAGRLIEAFPWGQTTEGHGYWYNTYNRLVGLSKGGPL